MKKTILAWLLLGSTLAPPAIAGTISYFVEGSPVQVSGLSDLVVTGSDMDGMLVTACFGSISSAAADCQTLGWADDSVAGQGSVAGTTSGGNVWNLAIAGDTLSNPWALGFTSSNNMLLTSLAFAAGDSLVLFDRTAPKPGTPGSFAGLDFAPNLSVDTKVTYLNADPLNDLFQGVKIEFNPYLSAGKYAFDQDTDNRVPEPATLMLLGFAMLALGLQRRRQR